MGKHTVLLTGATGILGSWILNEAIHRGYEPYVLMRDETEGRARARLRALFELIGEPDRADVAHIVRGDICQPNLGMDGAAKRDLLRNLSGMVHCAACTSFDPGRSKEVWHSNVDATQHVLEFLSGADVPYYHVSTAYVAGTRKGLAGEEELDLGQDFKNTYEQSKCVAEGKVRTAFAEGKVFGSIFRPSIIVGAAANYRISQFLNFYGFLRLVDTLARGSFEAGDVIRLRGTPEVTKNLVPVDWIAKAMWYIIEEKGPTGLAYHLTNPDPPTHEDIMAWANGYLAEHDCPTRFEVVRDLSGAPTFMEEVVHDRLRHYKSYLDVEAAYDRRNTDGVLNGSVPFPKMDNAFYTRLLYYGASQRWKDVFYSLSEEKEGIEPVAPKARAVPA